MRRLAPRLHVGGVEPRDYPVGADSISIGVEDAKRPQALLHRVRHAAAERAIEAARGRETR